MKNFEFDQLLNIDLDKSDDKEFGLESLFSDEDENSLITEDLDLLSYVLDDELIFPF